MKITSKTNKVSKGKYDSITTPGKVYSFVEKHFIGGLCFLLFCAGLYPSNLLRVNLDNSNSRIYPAMLFIPITTLIIFNLLFITRSLKTSVKIPVQKNRIYAYMLFMAIAWIVTFQFYYLVLSIRENNLNIIYTYGLIAFFIFNSVQFFHMDEKKIYQIELFLIFILAVEVIFSLSTHLLWRLEYADVVANLPWVSAPTYFNDGKHFNKLWLRPSGTLENPNDLGSLLVLTIPILFTYILHTYFLSKQKKQINYYILVLLILSVYSLLITFSRACWLGFMFSIILIIYLNREPPIFRTSLIIFLVIAGISLCLPMFFPRVLSMGDFHSQSISERLDLWKESVRLIKEHPIGGIGFGHFGVMLEAKTPIKIERFLYQNTHSTWLSYLVEMGGIVFTLYIFIIAYVLINMFKICKEDAYLNNPTQYTFLLPGILSGLVGYIITVTFEDYSKHLFLLVVFWLQLGIGYTLIRQRLWKKQND